LIEVVTLMPGVNPLPLTVVVAPLGPCAGVREMRGVVIVNGAVALSSPRSEPVAVTVYAIPDAGPVIVTGQPKPPLAETVPGQVPMAAVPLIAMVTVASGVNPVPVTVTETPLGPWVGVKEIIGVVMVNDAVALS
jgi:hypothetical protein